MTRKFFVFLFILAVLSVFAGIFSELKWLDYIFKPMIMGSIAGYFLVSSKNVPPQIVKPAFFAFGFSLSGDVLMMFTAKGEIYVLLGLFFFLMAQFFYIRLFQFSVKLENRVPFIRSNYSFLILYLVYGGIIFGILFPRLDFIFKIAVLIYIIAISTMSAMALNRYKVVNKLSFILVFSGSLFFIVSDTFIAFNLFYESIPHHRIYTMSTYIAAQSLIMTGILKQFEPAKTR
jgi:uncharacterized membrane protein YhhN